jgi:iron complex outermembrane receptor protein
LGRIVLLAAVLGVTGTAPALWAQEPVTALEPVVVTAERLPLSAAENVRTVVITREEIARQPARCVADLLADVVGVDVRTRGAGGVQADVAVRGATYEQTLVLIDGVKVTDPQTGHHNLDLPVTLGDIERIEVLKGPGSRVWGANAFGGVVNIVTRRPAGREVGLSAEGGGNGYLAAGASASGDRGGFSARLSASASRSDGDRENTDYEMGTVGVSAAIPAGPAGLRLLAGHDEKDFGANGFYSDRYPNQREDTRTSFASLAGNLGGGALLVTPKLFWRRHDDHYLLDSERPGFYENRHRTDVGGLEMQASLESAAGTTLFGGELAGEWIESTNLGDHDRRRGGLFANHRLPLGSLGTLAVGAFASYHSGWGWGAWPGADVVLGLGRGVRLHASVDKAYRVPTYTELYYTSPTNMGNPALRPEQAWTYEAGLEWRSGGHRADLSAFRREGSDLIDWVRADPEDPWQVQNLTSVRTDGVEASWEWRARAPHPFLRRLRAGYAWLESERDTGELESKYVLDHLRHQAVLDAEHALVLGLSQSWRFLYEQQLDGADRFVVDTRLWRPLGRGELFLEVTNLFDADYEGAGGVPQPGRWVSAGVRIDFGPW